MGLCPVWVLSWTYKSPLDAKALLQSWQLEGFSNHHWMQKLHCNQCSWRVSLQCGFFHALPNLQGMKKLFYAMDALIGFICSLRSFMHFQIFTGHKSSVAIVAVEWFLLSVGPFMYFQIITGRKSCLAMDANDWFISSLISFMHFQIFTRCKSSIAVMAVEGFLSSVGSFIHF